MKAIINMRDAANMKTIAVLNGLDDAMSTPDTALNTFVTTLQAYLNPAIEEYYALVPDETDVSIAAKDAEYKSSMHKGQITAGFAVADETRYRKILIPAPAIARYELLQGLGYRMKAADLTAFETALNTVSDTTHDCRHGRLAFRGGKQAVPAEGGYLVMEDYVERTCYMHVPDVSDKSKLATFAATLTDGTSGFTTAGVSKVVVLTRTGGATSNEPTEEAAYDSVLLKTRLTFSWVDSGVKKYMSLGVPGIKSTSLEDGSGDADKRSVLKATGDAIAAALTTLYGDTVRDLSFEGGIADMRPRERG